MNHPFLIYFEADAPKLECSGFQFHCKTFIASFEDNFCFLLEEFENPLCF